MNDYLFDFKNLSSFFLMRVLTFLKNSSDVQPKVFKIIANVPTLMLLIPDSYLDICCCETPTYSANSLPVNPFSSLNAQFQKQQLFQIGFLTKC